jgi:hypothetical protein
MAAPRRAGHTGLILGSFPGPTCEAIMIIDPLPVTPSRARYELRFQSLFNSGRGLVFPCDPQGQVQWDAMTEGARASFLRAERSVGREYASPRVQLSDMH